MKAGIMLILSLQRKKNIWMISMPQNVKLGFHIGRRRIKFKWSLPRISGLKKFQMDDF